MVDLASALVAAAFASLLQTPEAPQATPAPAIGYDVHHEREWQRSVAFINRGLVGTDWSPTAYDWLVEVRRVDTGPQRFEMRDCAGLAERLARVAQADFGKFYLPGIVPDHGRIGSRRDGFSYGLWGSTRDEQGFSGKVAIWPTGEMASAIRELDIRVRECADQG